MAVREDTARPAGREGRDPLRPAQPARDPAEDRDGRDDVRHPRARCRALVELENVAFEGFMVRRARGRRRSGCPTRRSSSSTTTSTSPCAPAGPASGSGRCATPCWCGSSTSTSSTTWRGWKGYYMYRNLFVVHLRYGENALVRVKPWLITAAVVLLSPLRGGRAEARNVIRAIRDARGMQHGRAVVMRRV